MRVLVALDGSDPAERALDYAIDLAERTDAAITVVHAVDPSVYDRGGDEPISTLGDAEQRLVLESIEDAEGHGSDLLAEASELAQEAGHEVDTALLYGEPVRQIVEFAAAEGFDAIVVGHQGRSARAGRMLGSVSKTVVERSSVPVTVVP